MSTATITKTGLPSGTWAIDTAHTKVGFAVKHMGVSTVRGEFHDYDGVLEVDENGQLHARGKVKVASVNTNQAQRDEHLRSADFFDVEQHPTIAYRSTRVTPQSSGHYDVEGDLTVRGVTKPVRLQVTFEGAVTDPWGNVRGGFAASAEIDREDFGLTWNQVLEGGGVLVGKKITIEIEAEAVLQA